MSVGSSLPCADLRRQDAAKSAELAVRDTELGMLSWSARCGSLVRSVGCRNRMKRSLLCEHAQF